MFGSAKQRVLELWIDEHGLSAFLESLTKICRDRAQHLFDELPADQWNELRDLEKQCERPPTPWFKAKKPVPSSSDGRSAEMWRNAVRGLSSLRPFAKRFKISMVGLPDKDCYSGGLRKVARQIIGRELESVIRIVELVVLPEIAAAEGRAPGMPYPAGEYLGTP